MERTEESKFQIMKLINDPIHGPVELHKFAELIMDTQQFQRLRHLTQLGLTDQVYPSATKTRFEHSVGTYHLAWELCSKLRCHMGSEDFTADEALCVALAGLCHDLGHGPFSHLWESLLRSLGHKDYHHEAMSVRVFDSIVEEISDRRDQEASKKFKDFMTTQWRNGPETHQSLIRDIILGGPDGDASRIPAERQFMFEIVNNKRTGFDVDKMDYMTRDSVAMGLMSSVFDSRRQMLLLRVLNCQDAGGGQRRLLVLRDKQVLDYIQLLTARRINHFNAYQHAKSIGFGKILEDALAAACENLKNGGSPTDSRAADFLLRNPTSLETLLWLTDHRLKQLLTENCGPEAEALMKRLENRRKYTHLASAMAVLSSEDETEAYEKKLRDAKRVVQLWNEQRGRQQGTTLAEMGKLDYGCGVRHPLDDVYYYTKTGEVRQCHNDPSHQLLFAALALSSLHISLVHLYERTPLELESLNQGSSDNKIVPTKEEEIVNFQDEMKNIGFACVS